MQAGTVSRFLVVILLAAITALLWLSYGFASTHRVFGTGALPIALHIAASISAAALFVVLVGQIFLRYGFESILRTEPTDLQRRLVVAVLGFAAIAVVLVHFGFDFSSILVFSALITGVVGLSIQPMLSSLVSGLAVQRVVRIGDGFLLNGEPVEITSLNWRSAVGRRADGTTIVLPNARLTDNTLEILARDRPARAEARLDVAMATAPHRLQKLASDLVGDLPEAERSQPVVVVPLNVERTLPLQAMTTGADDEHQGARYRIVFWVRHFSQRGAAEGRLLRRLWYAFRRESPVAPSLDSAAAALRALRPQADLAAAPGTTVETLVEAAEILLYDDGERIALPDRLEGRVCLLVGGALAEDLPGAMASGLQASAPRAVQGLTREASLGRIKFLLAERIGPYAEYAVDWAAAASADLATVCRTVAEEIDDPEDRARFLDAASPPAQRIHNPGLLFRSRRSRAHRLLSEPPLRAVDHALILAAPEGTFKNEGPDR